MPDQPVIVMARVTAHAPPRSVQVAFGSTGQQPSFFVQMGLDYGDALRVRQKPLPGIGTWGLVAFPRGDYRNGIWLTSYLPSQMDALTYSGKAVDPFTDYEAHFSGHWTLLDGVGQQTTQWADGSYFIASSGASPLGTPPTVFRNTVVNNKQTRIPYTRADRIPNPPSPYGYNFTHVLGTLVAIGTGGNMTVQGGPSKSLSIAFGGAIIAIDASGNVSINTPGTFTLHAGGDVTITGATINLN